MHKRTAIWLFAVLLIAGLAFPVFAQTREDTRIYIRSVAPNLAQANFFRQNFAAEAVVSGYTVTDSLLNADYILGLNVLPNTILYDDGIVEPAPPGEKQFLLRLNLVRNRDNVEIIAFSFPFTELDEMHVHNPYLLRHIMVNVPFSMPERVLVPVREEIVREVEVIREIEVIREVEVEVLRVVEVEVEVVKELEVEVVRVDTVVVEVGIEDPDLWRNKLLYLRVSADFPATYYQAKPDGLLNGAYIFSGDIGSPDRFTRLDDKLVVVPGATIGLELQFLSWMSAELNFELRFADAIDYTFIPGIGLQLKFPLKPFRHFMLEPYVAGSFSVNSADHSVSYPNFALGAGLQFGVKGGESGAWFLDVNFMNSLGEARTKNVVNRSFPNPEILHWNRFVVGLGVGYKLGFIDRGR